MKPGMGTFNIYLGNTLYVALWCDGKQVKVYDDGCMPETYIMS